MRIYLINTFKSKGLGFFIGILVPFFIIKCRDEVKTNSPPAVKDGMVLIPSGEFQMGSEGDQARDDESPNHHVGVDAFWMDQTEVTNAEFKAFVDATGYITTAEKKPNWEELKKELPPDTPKPNDSLLQAASLVFESTDGPVNLNDLR